MLLCKVVGNVWGTKKAKGMEGLKILELQPISLEKKAKKLEDFKLLPDKILAVDQLGAGIGEYVICAESSRVRNILLEPTLPIKTIILGIVDKADISV